MRRQRSHWNNTEGRPAKKTLRGSARKARTRRAALKRLKSSGHALPLLQVARTIPQPFTLNDITVAAWQAHPDLFGMKGYPYPDNHKVHYTIYGLHGLVAKGMLDRVEPGLFRVPTNFDVDDILRSEQRGLAEEPALA